MDDRRRARIVFVAVVNASAEFPWRLRYGRWLPVLRLRSKRGKLLLEISRRNVWPFLKTLLVDQRSIANL